MRETLRRSTRGSPTGRCPAMRHGPRSISSASVTGSTSACPAEELLTRTAGSTAARSNRCDLVQTAARPTFRRREATMAQLRERRSCFARELRASRLAPSSLPLRTTSERASRTRLGSAFPTVCGSRPALRARRSSRPTAISAYAGTAATTAKDGRADPLGGRAPQCRVAWDSIAPAAPAPLPQMK
jgi:hypothetical protein